MAVNVILCGFVFLSKQGNHRTVDLFVAYVFYVDCLILLIKKVVQLLMYEGNITSNFLFFYLLHKVSKIGFSIKLVLFFLDDL